jgi:peptidoglycan/LPS O-acetylase OafA/YrhL
VLAYALSRRVRPRVPSLLWPVALAVLTVGSAWLPQRNESTWIVCLLLGAMLPHFQEMPGGWVARLAQWIARYSYGIYLAHVFCIWAAFVALGGLPSPARFAVFILLVAGLPVLLFHGLEHPFTRLGIRISSYLTAGRRESPQAAAA